MPLRELVKIDEEKCDGCGLCVPACAEGAIQVINGKATLVSEIYCDGLGACLGHCPQDAITVEKVQAADFDVKAVEKHLAGLTERDEEVTKPQRHAAAPVMHAHAAGGCPGSRMLQFDKPADDKVESESSASRPTQLRQWPVQLHLVSPMAPYFQNADVLLAADCVAFALGDFHRDYLANKGLAIACPKLDTNQEVYENKLLAMFDSAKINTLTVMIMEVPCCGGLLAMAQRVAARASRKVPIKCLVVGVRGDIIDEHWV